MSIVLKKLMNSKNNLTNINKNIMGKKSNAKKIREDVKESPKKTILEKQVEIPAPGPINAQPKRQIIIETDGNTVTVVKNETAGNLELLATMQAIIGTLSRN